MKSCNHFVTLIMFFSFFLFLAGCGSSDNNTIDGDDTESENEVTDGDLDQDDVDGSENADNSENVDIEEDGDSELEAETEQEAEIEYAVGLPPRPDFAPSLMLLPEDKATILSRIEKEPFASILDKIVSSANKDHYDLPENVFDSAEQRNGVVAQHAAFLAWLNDDSAMADKARDFIKQLSREYSTHEDGDLNIRMPSIVMCYANALDFLIAGNFIPQNEIEDAEDKLTYLIYEFYKEYVVDDLGRFFSINLTQNNHPIRTACSIGYIAMAFPEYEHSEEMANWAFSELDYLFGPNGQYIQPDGGVSEGPFYFRFGFGAAQAFFWAYKNRVGEPRVFSKDCINRIEDDPWTNNGCVDDEPFVYTNLLKSERVQKTADWILNLRMPDGKRPPLEDGNIRDQNGQGLFAAYLNRPDLYWDFVNNDMNMSGGMDLFVQHLAYMPEDMEPVEPDFKNVVMYDAGQAIFRSDWGENAVWAMINAEHGSVRKTVHDHIDSTSFQLYAYGEYLLIDTGYYKPVQYNNARTCQAIAHSVILIDGEEVPPKGLLTDFGDTDAFLENESLSDEFSYVEARQPLEKTTTIRSFMMVHERYLVIADRLETTVTEPRLHTWRLHGLAGYGEGKDFQVNETYALWEREKAGVEVYLSSTDDGLTLGEPEFREHYAPHVHKFISDEGHHGVLDGTITAVSPGFLAIAAPYSTSAEEGDKEYKIKVTPLTFTNDEKGVAAYLVEHAEGDEIVLLRKPDAPETIGLSNGDTIKTDAEFVIISRNADHPVTHHTGGTYISLNPVEEKK